MFKNQKTPTTQIFGHSKMSGAQADVMCADMCPETGLGMSDSLKALYERAFESSDSLVKLPYHPARSPIWLGLLGATALFWIAVAKLALQALI